VHLHIVPLVAQARVNNSLVSLRLFPGPLELYEQGPPARDEEQEIGPPGLADQLDALNAELLQRPVDDPALDVTLKSEG
jgi:hypothetical protein